MGVTRVKDEAREREKEEKRRERKERIKGKVKEEPKAIVRVAETNLDANKRLIHALRGIKGISFAMAKAVCVAGGFDPHRKLGELSPQEIEKLEDVIRNPLNYGIPPWMLNRRRDVETGKDMHLTGSQVDIVMKMDVQRLINLKTWHGMRHALGLPVRGQKTRSHFRKGRTVGVMRKAAKLLGKGG